MLTTICHCQPHLEFFIHLEMVSLVSERNQCQDDNGSEKCLGPTNLSQYVHEIVSLSEVLTSFSGQDEIIVLDKARMVCVQRVLTPHLDNIHTQLKLNDVYLFFCVDETKGTVFQLNA